ATVRRFRDRALPAPRGGERARGQGRPGAAGLVPAPPRARIGLHAPQVALARQVASEGAALQLLVACTCFAMSRTTKRAAESNPFARRTSGDRGAAWWRSLPRRPIARCATSAAAGLVDRPADSLGS